MSKITEEAVRQELGLTSEMLSTTNSAQTGIIEPRLSHTFFGKPGRNYLVSITNIDDSFDANQVLVYNLENDSLVADLNISPLRNDVAMAQMTTKGIRIYNFSKESATQRPKIYVVLYPA